MDWSLRIKSLAAAALLSFALNAAFVVRSVIRHHQANTSVTPPPPGKFVTEYAIDSRIFTERSARFAGLKPVPADVLFVGDSIAASIVSDIEDREREGDLAAGWAGLSVHERCVPSITTIGLLKILPGAGSLQAKTIFVWCGTNDVAQSRPLNEIADTYRNIVAGLQKSCPRSRIIVISVLPMRFHDDLNWRTKQLNEYLVKLARNLRVEFVDVTGDVSDSSGRLDELITQDGVHLLAAGLLRVEVRLAECFPAPTTRDAN